ncbi:hypothetical protein BaRGS_00000675, partial [Batillaria attramentaria]
VLIDHPPQGPSWPKTSQSLRAPRLTGAVDILTGRKALRMPDRLPPKKQPGHRVSIPHSQTIWDSSTLMLQSQEIDNV